MRTFPHVRANAAWPGLTLGLALLAGCGGRAVSPASDAEPGGDDVLEVVSRARPEPGDRERATELPSDGSAAEGLPATRGGDVPVASGEGAKATLTGACPTHDEAPRSSVLGGANDVLRALCVGCHGSPSGASDDVLALPRFDGLGDAVARGLLDPCDPDSSPIWSNLLSGSMPPPGENLARPSAADLRQLEQAMAPLCRGGEGICPDVPGYPGCRVALIETTLGGSCGDCHGRTRGPAGEAHLFGTASADDLAGLIQNGYVVPCDADASPLVASLRRGPVPTHGVCVPTPSENGVERLADQVNGLCEVRPSNPGLSEATRVLSDRCGDCHGAYASAPPGGGTAEVLEALARGGFFTPCDAERSPIVMRMRDGSMPPADRADPVSEDEIATVVRFVEGFCAPVAD